jgi:hypothetical protein
VREIDDLPATVWWAVQVRQSSLHIAQCIARVQESCAALLYSIPCECGKCIQNRHIDPLKQGAKNMKDVAFVNRTNPQWQNTASNQATGSSSMRPKY